MKRFDHVAELRELAKRIRKMRFRSADQYVEAMDTLARDIETRADEVMRNDDPPERMPWPNLPRVVQSAAGRSVAIESRARRQRVRTPVRAAEPSLIERVFGASAA